MHSGKVSLVLLLGAALHAAAPARATAQVRVGASILRPLSFSVSSLSELRVAPSLADGSTLLVSDPARKLADRVLDLSETRTPQLPSNAPSPLASPDPASAVTVMLVYN